MTSIINKLLVQQNTRKLVLILPVITVFITWPTPHHNNGLEAVQAAIGKLPPVPIEILLYQSMISPPVLPNETLLASVPADQPPEIHQAIIPDTAPPADGKEKPDAQTCDMVECKYFELVIRVSKKHQVEPALIAAIIKAESGYNPKAVSHKGARGMMQLMPLTAAELGVENSFNPEHNINGGVRYYKKLLNRYNGNIELALAAYNAGMRTVKKYNGVPPFEATRLYIKKVLHYYQVYKKTLSEIESA